jgi:hypothetical protein
MHRTIACLFALIVCITELHAAPLESANPGDLDGRSFDVVVVGGTPSGIACAVRAAREGLNVLLVNRHAHVGGIVTSGLSVWDTQYEGHRSPIYDEVREALFHYYKTKYGPDSQQYRDALPGKTGHTNGRYEPHVAEEIFNDLIARESRITVLLDHVLTDVERDGALIKHVTLQYTRGAKASRVSATAFVDATYEGDLAASAKAPYRVGREARSEYDEPHAGIIFMHPSSNAPDKAAEKIAAAHDALNLRKFTGFQSLMPQATGAADPAVQACNYRTILTTDAKNRVPIAQPADYAPYFLKSLEIFSGVESIPTGKFGWNRPQLVGLQTEYVEADWPTRKRIEDEHWQMTMGLLYFLQNDPTVPEGVRKAWLEYGLAKDEFADNGHRPYEMYIREARRIVGRAIYTEHDATLAPGLGRAPVHADSIAVTEWYMDSHSCTTARVPGGLEEGKFMLHHETFPGQIPYAAMLPKDIDNLLVPVCLSATHVAWGTVRLEPVLMQTGEAAGYALALAKSSKVSPAKIDTDKLVRKLSQSKFMLSFFNDVDPVSDELSAKAAQFFSTKGFFNTYDARLDKMLSDETANVWAKGFKQLRQGTLDPTALAQEVVKAEKSTSHASAGSFRKQFGLTPEKNVYNGSSGVISRGVALQILYQAIQEAQPP